MFGSKQRIKSKADGVDSIIGGDTETVGAIKFKGGIKVDGIVDGGLIAHQNKGESTAVVGPTGKILGSVTADNVIIAGTVIGDVTAKSVFIQSTAHIIGSINYEVIQIEPGAQIQGMVTSSTTNNNNEQPLQEAA